MSYITAASSITHQPTFKNAGFSGLIKPLTETSSEPQSPNYKEYIDAGLLRRMSKILRMSVACAKDCLQQAGIEQPDSIVVGTGLGCLQDTEKFLSTFLTIEGLLPPTSFIQSTHNTIAGQISLSIGNHGYNMTHTQNTLSFEHALTDAVLLLNEEDKNVLVGAADEFIELLDVIGHELKIAPILLTTGASFFVLSKEKTDKALAKMVDTETFGLVGDIRSEIDHFLQKNGLSSADVDLVLFADGKDIYGDSSFIHAYFKHFHPQQFVNYSLFSGFYPTTSAFALHYAVDQVQYDKEIRNVLIYNNLNTVNLGLTLIRSLEA